MRYLIIVVSLLLSSFSSLSQQAPPLPIEAFTKHGDYLNMALSPDGKHMFARLRIEGRVVLIFINTETMKMVGGVKPENKDEIHSAEWISNERVVYQVQEMQSSFDQPIATGELFAINMDGSDSTILFGYRAEDGYTGSRISSRDSIKASAEIISYLPDDDRHILIAEYPWTQEGNYLYDDRKKNPIISRLNVNTGKRRRQEFILYPGASAFATDAGEVKFIRWRTEQGKSNSAYRLNEDDDWTPLKLDDINSFIPVSISNDGKKVFLYGDVGEQDLNTIYQFDLETQALTQLFSDLSADIAFTNWDPKLKMPVVGFSHNGKVDYHYAPVESETASLHKRLVSAFGDQQVSISSQSEDGSLVLVNVRSDINPGEYYIFNTTTNDAEFVWANRSWLDPRVLAQKTPISFTAKDGLPINGYLTLPLGAKEDSNYPLVVMIHGGPHGIYDTWTFDGEVQLLANRGYGVLQVNYRGSGGRGDAFERAGYRNWGTKMIQDIIDGTEYVLNEYPLNTENVCSYGASYGGYAAMMVAARSPELFKCTIGYVGVYDLNNMYLESDIPRNMGGIAYLERVIGRDAKELADNSPVNLADRIKANVMLIHGEKDTRVSVVNTEAMKERLEAQGKTVPYLNFSRAGHGVYDESGRLELYTNLVSFLDQNIGK